jgi:WD40 repeat protein
VEDVVWKPNSAAELASVGDDRGLLLWDTRAGTAPALRKTDAHGTHDLHTVDWSGLREELLATGATLADLCVKCCIGVLRPCSTCPA